MFTLKSTIDCFIKNKFILAIALGFLFFLIIVVIICYLNNNYNLLITVFISSLALLVSLATFFKDRIFPFRVKVIAGSILLINPKSTNVIDLILPIMFINTSYSDGIILSVWVKVTKNNQEVKRMVPFHELSNELVKQIFEPETKEKPKSSIRGEDFFPFQIKSKEGLRKNITFVAAYANSSFTSWEPGTYKFEVYLQVEGNENLEKYADFEHTIDTQTFDALLLHNYCLIHRKADLSILKQFKSL